MIRYLYLLFVAATCPLALHAQTMQELEERKQQALARIEATQQLIEEVGKSRRQNLQRVRLLQMQIQMRNRAIEQIGQQIDMCQAAIAMRSRAIDRETERLNELKQSYAQFLREVQFQRGESNVIFSLLASDNLAQLYRRLQFYRDYLNHQRARHDTIRALEVSLRAERDSLAAQHGQLEQLREEELAGRTRLEQERVDYNEALRRISQRNASLQQELKLEQARMERINAAIAKLLEEEAKQHAKLQRDAKYKQLAKRFELNQGKLPWPVRKGGISRGYGRHSSKVFKGVSTQSMGVDITTAKGAYAYPVFEGTVSKIAHIPGGQNVVIVRHGDYLTLYSNIGEVNVHVGESIQVNSPIGRIHTPKGDSHAVLHFEIWKGFTSQDPAKWLHP